MTYKARLILFDGKGWTPEARSEYVQEILDEYDPPDEIQLGSQLAVFSDQILATFPDTPIRLDARAGVAHDIWFGYA